MSKGAYSSVSLVFANADGSLSHPTASPPAITPRKEALTFMYTSGWVRWYFLPESVRSLEEPPDFCIRDLTMDD